MRQAQKFDKKKSNDGRDYTVEEPVLRSSMGAEAKVNAAVATCRRLGRLVLEIGWIGSVGIGNPWFSAYS